jgi:hypothetical protein
MPEGINKVEIPFTESNNLVVIPVVLNNFLKLNFILDTGVETPILTEIAYANIIGMEYIREVVISGPGLIDSVRALVGQKVNVKLPGNIIGHNLNLLVLQEDYLKLSEKMGMDVHGIIGYDIFQKFVVEIDYDEKILSLHRPSAFRPRKKYLPVPMEVEHSKPFLKSYVNQNKVNDTIKLLIDTGASHALLLDLDQMKISIPNLTIPTRLGTGLGGEIPGQLGRIDSFRLNDYEFKEVIVSIPRADAYSQLIKRGSRQGTLGGDVLSRLRPVFDYSNETLYISKSKKYKHKFEYDMSGLSISSRGTFLDSLYVNHVREGSPADLVGIQPNDVILSINGYTPSYYPMSQLLALLRKKPNFKVKMKILRKDEKMKKIFRLKRTI